MAYSQAQHDFVIASGGFLGRGWVLHDGGERWEEFDERKLPVYFNRNYKRFIQRLERFRLAHKPLTAQEEKELGFMVESLVATKRAMFGK